jgi:nitronate monooxygenase
MYSNNFTKQFNLQHPLVVAPMAGGPSSPEFVVASCQAGAMGSVGAAYSSAKQIEEFVSKVRSETQNPIAINLFIPGQEPQISENQLSRAIKVTEKFRQQFGLPTPTLTAPYEENFDEQFETVLKLKPEVFSFVFGLLKPEYVKAAKAQNIFLLGTATTIDEALALQESGVDGMTFNQNSDR